MALPRAILFDLDDTLIRAYAQPEEAWRRLLDTFAEPLAAPDAAAIERVRVAVMDEARSLWSDQMIAAKWRLDIPGARAWRRAVGWPGWAMTTKRWPIASPMPSPRCDARNTGSIPTPTPRSTHCGRPA